MQIGSNYVCCLCYFKHSHNGLGSTCWMVQMQGTCPSYDPAVQTDDDDDDKQTVLGHAGGKDKTREQCREFGWFGINTL